MTFIAAAIIGGVGAIGGGLIAANSASKASKTAAQSADQATALQREMWQQGRADQQPWLNAGTNALRQMQDPSMAPQQWKNFTMADYQQDPGYAFRMSEGLKALDRTAAARGGLLSGGALKGATRYGQDMASQEYGAAYNRYNTNQTNSLARGDMQYNRNASLAGVGQTSAFNMANQGSNYANNAGNNMIAGGNSAAAGQMGVGNSINNGIQSGISSYNQSNMLNYLRSPTPQVGGYVGDTGGGYGTLSGGYDFTPTANRIGY